MTLLASSHRAEFVGENLRGGKYVLMIAGVAAGYFLAAWFGLSMATVAKQVSPVWPPTGFALAAVLLLGKRVWPGIALGALLANVNAHEPLLTACGIATGNTLEAVVGAALLRRFVNFHQALDQAQDVVGLAAFGAGVGPVISATLGVSSLCLGGVAPWGRFELMWVTWWFGDAMGAIIFAPPLLTFGPWFRAGHHIRRIPEFAAFLTLACVAGFLVLVDPSTEIAHLKYVLFPLFLWCALRFEQFLTGLALVLVSGVALWGVDWNSDAFPADSMNSRLLLMQTFVGMLALSSLTLGAVTTELRRVADTHRQSQERLSAIFHQVVAGVAQMDLSGRFVMVNQRLCDIVGRTADELMKLRLGDLTNPDDVPRQAELLERCANQGKEFANESRLVTPAGGTVWASSYVSAVRTAEGRPAYLVAVFQDITDRKEADGRRRLLFAELNHRIKNTLASVLSIVSRTSSMSVDNRAFQQDLEARLKSLAETHSILMQENWEGAELSVIAGRELRPHLSAQDSRVRLEGPRVYLTPRAAISLHLVLHELTTNAAKYGALSAPCGRVELTWSVADEGEGARLRLWWRESGGPPVSPPRRRGFGSCVLEEAVEYELDGSTAAEYREEGFRYDLVVPLTGDVGRVLGPSRGVARGAAAI